MKGIKVAIGFAFILSTASLAGNVFLFQRFNAERNARQQLESRQAQLEDQNAFLKSEVARTDHLKQENERFLAQIKDYTNQRNTLKKELDEAYKQASDLRKRIQELEAEKNGLAQQVNLGVVTDQAVVREAAKLPAPPAAKVEEKKVPDQGKKKAQETAVDPRPLQVLSVNRQFRFVVVNVGLRGHVKLGDTLRVEQNGKLVGRIQVEKLYENFSACTILEEIKPDQIREGDLVRVA